MLQKKVSQITFFAVLKPHTSVRTSPSIYAAGKVIVPASKREIPPIDITFTAIAFDAIYIAARSEEIITKEFQICNQRYLRVYQQDHLCERIHKFHDIQDLE